MKKMFYVLSALMMLLGPALSAFAAEEKAAAPAAAPAAAVTTAATTEPNYDPDWDSDSGD